MTIRKAILADVSGIRAIAEVTWPVAYVGIIDPEQIRYMLDWMYSEEKISEAISASNQDFLILESEGKKLGFAGIEHRYEGKQITRLHKLYVLPETQGTGAGKALLNAVIDEAKNNSSTLLHLNVNKANKAVEFYKHIGFIVSDEEVLDIGNGYVMDDYIMTLRV